MAFDTLYPYLVCRVLVVVMLLASTAASAYRVPDGRLPVARRPRQVAASVVTPSHARIKLQPSQIQALLALDTAWGLWNNNKSNVFCDGWGALTGCNRQGMVTHLSVYSDDEHTFGFGVVPPAMTNLSALQQLGLSHTGITGSLEILGQLPKLQNVDLSFTGFNGSIPESISNAKSLTFLDLKGVAVSGSLPCSISRLTALEYLYIGMPQFHVSTDPFLSDDPTDILSAQSSMRPPVMQGSMDDLSCLAPLTRLQDLALMSLNLTAGELPSSLSALTSLTTLDLSFLPITRLPQWMSSLSNLIHLDVTGNFDVHRSAPFPTEWMALTELRTLRAGLNGFTGSIPSSISALSLLSDLELYCNNLSGSIPPGISEFIILSHLGLSFNNLTGAVPALNRGTLQTLDLSHNHLTIMPTAINAKKLNLSYNDLQGSLPAYGIDYDSTIDLSHNSLSGGLDGLFKKSSDAQVSLFAKSCNFSGPFPSYPNLKIERLDVSNNSFTGPFPSVLLNEESLTKDINLSHNNFTGPLPPEIAGVKSLEHFNISHNHFSGVVPTTIWALEQLKSLSMAHNQLQGTLPAALLAPDLAALDLQGNAFSGPLSSFASWQTPSLLVLDVSNNQLNGSLSDSISHYASLQHLGLGGNNLSGPIPASLGILVNLTSLNISGSGLTCPADASKCMVLQSNTTSFCRLCFSFCSSCTPSLFSAHTEAPASAAAPASAGSPGQAAAPAPRAPSASAPCMLVAAAINLYNAAAIVILSVLILGM